MMKTLLLLLALMAELDMAKLRAVTAELGYWPATTDDEHLENLRADNERFDRMNAHDPQGLKWRKMCNRDCSKSELETWYR